MKAKQKTDKVNQSEASGSTAQGSKSVMATMNEMAVKGTLDDNLFMSSMASYLLGRMNQIDVECRARVRHKTFNGRWIK